MASWHILFFLLGLVFQAQSVYEEQLGEFDWLKQNIGHVEFVGFSSTSKKKTTAYAATRSNVLAAVSLKSGSLLWRQVLPEGEKLDLMMVHKSAILVVSQGGNTLRTYLTADGALVWDTHTYAIPPEYAQVSTQLRGELSPLTSADAFAPSAVFCADVTGDELADVVVLQQGLVRLLDGSSGEELWSWPVPAGLVCTQLTAIAGQAGSVGVFCGEDGAVVALQLALSRTAAQRLLARTRTLVQIDGAVLVSGSLVALDRALARLVAVPASAPSSPFYLPLPEACSGGPLSLAAAAGAFAVLGSGSSYCVFAVDGAGLKAVTTVSAGPGQRWVFGGEHGEDGQIVNLATALLEQQRLTVSTGVTIAKVAVTAPAVARVWVRAGRALVVGSDSSLSLLSQDTTHWTREEALAEITQVDFVELPAQSSLVRARGGYPGLLQRLGPHLQELAAIAKSAVAPVLQLPATVGAMAEAGFLERLLRGAPAPVRPVRSAVYDGPLHRDLFGFRQLMVVGTRPGKIFGLETRTGGQVWTFQLPTHLWKTVVIGPHLFAAITKSESEAVVYLLDPLTGLLLDTLRAPGRHVDALVLPFAPHGQHSTILLVDEDVKATVVPAASASLVRDHAKNIFFHLADPQKGVVRGYGLKASGAGFFGIELWNLVLPEEEVLSSLGERQEGELISTALRVTGGITKQKTMFRYLSPNLLLLGTVRKASGRPVVPSLSRSTDPSVNLYILDIVTGRVLDKLVHRDGAGPVSVLQSENVLVWHFFNASAPQYQVCVAELFQDRDEKELPALAARKQQWPADLFSSRTAGGPVSLQQCYVLQSGVRALAVTKTRRGLSSRMFLVGLSSGQVLSVPKAYLDPRRPRTPTNEDREEGLLQYSPELPINPLAFVTYNNTIPNLRGIQSGPARLESTSLLAVWGLDLFFTQVTPSGTFDLLSEDFNYLFLIVSVTGVLVAVVVGQRWANDKQLLSEWK